jgi:ubiquitin-conjugating enzyme E2 O
MDFHLSDFDSFSENSSYEDQEEAEFMYGGQARNILSSLEETIGKIDDFLSFERGFIHGDIVCSATDPSGQTGRVVNVDITVDLESIQGKRIEKVNSKKLLKIRSISLGDHVVYGPWLGKVAKIIDDVTVLFDDGSKCSFVGGPDKIIPLSPDVLEDSQYPYYPGQRVKVDFSTSKWNKKQDEGTVCGVSAGSVFVDWLACIIVGGEKVRAPQCVQDSRKLTVLSCFSNANWQLGDWCMLKDFQEIFVISKTRTRVDVIWQNGILSSSLDSQSLISVNITDAHDFWPDQFVTEKGTSEDSNTNKWGVVRCVDAKERMVRVKWESFLSANLENECDLKTEPFVEESIVSAYELIEHPDYSYFIGDVVFRLQKGQFVDLPDGEDNANSYLSCIGIVVGLKDGHVEVKWATGLIIKVAPYKIFRLDKYEDLSAAHVLHEEMNEQENRSLGQVEKALSDTNIDNKNCKKSSAFVGFITNIASTLFGSMGFTSLLSTSKNENDGQNTPISSEDNEEEKLDLCDSSIVGPTLSVSGWPTKKSVHEIGEIFKQFDMVNGCVDHHFLDGAGKGLVPSQVKRSWLKKVQQEWSILEKDLPETTYVRMYEERMDLIRAAIVGVAGTPYHNGLFIFDIFLPPDYPSEPPVVHYISGGLRVNPNLYESGKVCLSLLNTWTGTGTETWNPESSTILQLLLSLQALVLNEKPYFNEAGYDKQIGKAEGEKNSISYNENAHLMTLKTMIFLMRKPPQHFEGLVEEHFNRRSECILKACKSYMDGFAIGFDIGDENSKKRNENGSSTGFKIMLGKLLPVLIETFANKGIDCSKYIDMIK